ncbi:MAG: DUF4129 domain-containing protein [Prevotella sp.]|nr:DUF4129 domain-containing protein [Prevotella sp.]
MNYPVDTLVCDTARIAAWQQDAAFDYNRELIEPQQSIWQWLYEVVIGFLGKLIQDAMQMELSWMLMALATVVLLCFIGWFIYKYRPGLFGGKKEKALDYELEEDTIYGIDFNEAIREALARKDYREAIRLKYLQTLKQLTESGQIDWQLHKTPTQYTYECTDEPFLRMTRHFLRIRYGNFEATPEIYEEIAAANLSLNPHLSTLNYEEKGGDA